MAYPLVLPTGYYQQDNWILVPLFNGATPVTGALASEVTADLDFRAEFAGVFANSTDSYTVSGSDFVEKGGGYYLIKIPSSKIPGVGLLYIKLEHTGTADDVYASMRLEYMDYRAGLVASYNATGQVMHFVTWLETRGRRSLHTPTPSTARVLMYKASDNSLIADVNTSSFNDGTAYLQKTSVALEANTIYRIESRFTRNGVNISTDHGLFTLN